MSVVNCHSYLLDYPRDIEIVDLCPVGSVIISKTLFLLISCYTLHMSNQIFLNQRKMSPTGKLFESIESSIFASHKESLIQVSILISNKTGMKTLNITKAKV